MGVVTALLTNDGIFLLNQTIPHLNMNLVYHIINTDHIVVVSPVNERCVRVCLALLYIPSL